MSGWWRHALGDLAALLFPEREAGQALPVMDGAWTPSASASAFTRAASASRRAAAASSQAVAPVGGQVEQRGRLGRGRRGRPAHRATRS